MAEPLTHSKRQTWRNCQRLFYLRHELRLQPVVERGPRRRGHAFGVAIFEALKAIERDGPDAEVGTPIRTALAEAYSERHARTQEESDELEFEQHALSWLVPAYLRRYPGNVRRELQYSLPLIHPTKGWRHKTFRQAGKLDGLEKLAPRHALLIEDKLTTQITKQKVERLCLDSQVCEYVDALERRGWTAEVAFRLTRWPSIRRRQTEDLDEFCQRFIDDINQREEWYFHEERFQFPTHVLEDFRRGRWAQAQMIEHARSVARRSGFELAYPQNDGWCGEYGGCDFVPHCTKQPGYPDLYQVVEDSPELTQEATNGKTT